MVAPRASPGSGAEVDDAIAARAEVSARDPDAGGVAPGHAVTAVREETLRISERAEIPAEYRAHPGASQAHSSERVQIAQPLLLAQGLKSRGRNRVGARERREHVT